MNNETEARDELIERIAELADQFACGAAGEPVVYALHGPMDFAEEVIELVTAARDAEIRSALLSDGAVIEAVESIRTSPVLDRSSYHSLPPEGPGAGEPGKWLGHEIRREWREYVGRPAIEAALDHIGLGDATGGQG